MKRSPAEPAAGVTSFWRDPVVLTAACAAVFQAVVVWSPAIPLGVPGEWIWSRIPYWDGSFTVLAFGAIAAAPVVAGYLALCRFAEPDRPGARRLGLRLLMLTVGGFAFLWVVQEAAPQDYNRLGRAPLVLFYPSFSGYFTEARAIDDLPAYLASYELLMARGDVLHLGTHPPGLIVSQRLLLDVFEANPALTRLALATRPVSVVESYNTMAEVARGGVMPGDLGLPPSAAEQAEIWTAALLVQVAAALAVVPLYRLCERTYGVQAAWRTACLWPLVPSLAVFLPKSDALLPLFALVTLDLWYGPGSPRPFRAAAAGLTFWLGMTFSLAMIPVAVLAAALSLVRIVASPREERLGEIRATLRSARIVASAFLVATLLVWAAFDLNLFAVWSWNYRNHAAFYAEYDRTYWRWLLVNPFELAVGLGLPAAVAAGAGFLRSIRSGWAVSLPVAAVVGLLWVSGKNSGEAARLWLLLMPWLLWNASRVWQGPADRGRWTAVLLLQLAVCCATAVRVNGFAFDELIGSGD